MTSDTKHEEDHHTFEFNGEPDVPLTWDAIEARCHSLWQIPADRAGKDPEDLRKTYADIRKRVIESNETCTEADNEFSWLKGFKRPKRARKHLHSTAKYGVPMHVTGDPQTANLVVCMLNPNVPYDFDKNASLEDVMKKEDLPICEISGQLSYEIYHTAENVFSLYWKNFVAQGGNSEGITDDSIRKSIISAFYYYLHEYYTHIIGGSKPDTQKYHSVHGIPRDLQFLADQSTSPGKYQTYTQEHCEDYCRKTLKVEDHIAFIGEQNLQRLLNAPICNIELWPFRSKVPGTVENIIVYQHIYQLSAAIIVRRVLDSFYGYTPNAPIVVFARKKNKYILDDQNLFDTFFAKANVCIKGEKINTAAQFMRKVAERDNCKTIFFSTSSNQSGSLSRDNLRVLEPQKNKDRVGEKVQHKSDETTDTRMECDEHHKLFENALRIDLPANES